MLLYQGWVIIFTEGQMPLFRKDGEPENLLNLPALLPFQNR
jgi:hypothetical protein